MKFHREVENLIANLRGLPEDRGRSRSRPTHAVGSLVEVIVQRYRLDKPRIEELVMANWKAIVGEKTAHRCRPQKIVKERVLVITATNSVVRSELQFNQRQVLKRIQQIEGCEGIRELVIKAG